MPAFRLLPCAALLLIVTLVPFAAADEPSVEQVISDVPDHPCALPGGLSGDDVDACYVCYDYSAGGGGTGWDTATWLYYAAWNLVFRQELPDVSVGGLPGYDLETNQVGTDGRYDVNPSTEGSC